MEKWKNVINTLMTMTNRMEWNIVHDLREDNSHEKTFSLTRKSIKMLIEK